ncbi:ABC transporter ATP-binding protein [Candidatus Harpocratesius sp.]
MIQNQSTNVPIQETGYFSISQYKKMDQWISVRNKFLLIIQGWGKMRVGGHSIYFKGKIVHQPRFPRPRSILVVIWEYEIDKKPADIPLILRISKNCNNLESFEITNSFLSEDNTAMAFESQHFIDAQNYRDLYLSDYNISVISLGHFHEKEKIRPALLKGFISHEKQGVGTIYCKDVNIWDYYPEEFKQNHIFFTQEIFPLFLYNYKKYIKDSDIHESDTFFEIKSIILILHSELKNKHNIIEIKNLSVKFGKRTVIKNVNMNISHGSIIGIIGESGAGKSTTVKAMLSQNKYEGEIRILGIDAHQTKRIAPYIGYVPQDLSMIYHNFNALENMIHFGRQYNLEEEEITRRAKRIFKDLDLDKYMGKPVKNLSGGQKRRVSVAMAMVHNPKILILDEPTSGLDPVTRFSLWKYLDNINKIYGITLIVISHYLDEIEYSDKSAIYMKGIGFFEFASPRELKKKLPGKGKAVEITLKRINLQVLNILNNLDGVESIIQRGSRIRILSDSDLNEIALLAKKALLDSKIEVHCIENQVDIDIMDYFTYFSRKLGSGKNFKNR